jgi:hypothetical protein
MKFLRILGWAIFLGASWTWCIGMYLPALLVRDYGIWAFVVFAVPNVVGAAAMAWVLPDAEASLKLQQDHLLACQLFSCITIAFHGYFWGWFAIGFVWTIFPLHIWLFLGAIVLAIYSLLDGDGRAAAIITTLISVVFAILLRLGHWIPMVVHGPQPGADLAWLALVCLFGFLLCPYLDLTFHHARQATSSVDGKAAFAIGFGVVFCAAILFTLSYSAGWSPSAWHSFDYPCAALLGSYIFAQTLFKFLIHGRALSVSGRSLRRFLTLILILATMFLGYSVNFDSLENYNGISRGEFIYRIFLSFYGLFFPAYVWICIFNKKPWRIWLVAILIAAPMYWMGFIERQMIWLLPGVAVPFIAGLRPIARARRVP